MQKIIPSLWFDHNCEEAMSFYVSVFPDSKITDIMRYPDNAKDEHLQGMDGKVLHGEFELAGHQFSALDGGPLFKFNQSISFILNFDPSRDGDAAGNLRAIWNKLAEGGTPLMELGEYPFSKQYGWVQDRFGLSWQLILSEPSGEERPFVTPSLLFNGEHVNQAGDAMRYYTSVFRDARAGTRQLYEIETGPAKPGSVMFADFSLEGVWFAAMDAATDMNDPFNEAISFVVLCADQSEIDYYWEALSAVPESEQCGWCKDKFGVSWQIIPEDMGELIESPAALDAMMKMKKIDIATLAAAASG